MKYFFSIFCCCCFNAYSQYTISGKIQNVKGEELPYASIYLVHSKVGAVSEENGNFTLKIPEGNSFRKLDTLIVSYVGYDLKKIPIYFNNKVLLLNVTLQASPIQLKEIIILPGKEYTPEEIVKRAIKQVKKNYCREQVLMNGFYRELIKENDKWVELNEAAIMLTYIPYPQKGFIRKALRNYWDTYWSGPGFFNGGNVFMYSQYFEYFTPLEEQARILSSRVSHNYSQLGFEPDPHGGPMDLVAIDKIKYLYDFLDPNLTKEYHYALSGQSSFEGEQCYVIDFYPNVSYLKKPVGHSLNKKMKTAIYSGRMYITINDFAVVNFQCQFSADANFKGYEKRFSFPEYVMLNVNYKKYNNYRILHKVEVENRITKKSARYGNITYTCFRSLYLSMPEKSKNIKFNEEEILPLCCTSLRVSNDNYDSNFWKQYETSPSYPPIPTEIKRDLEKVSPLEKQFASRNLPIDSISRPQPLKIPYVQNYNYVSTIDDYHWLTQKDDTLTQGYLYEENKYYKDVFQKLNKYRKSFLYHYRHMYKPDTIQEIINKEPYQWQLDEEGHTCLFIVDSVASSKKIFDYSVASNEKTNFLIEKYKLRNEKIAYLYSERGDVSFTLIVKPFGENYTIDSISKVTDFLWLNDSVILYVQASATERSYKLLSHKSGDPTASDSLLYMEKDTEFDISLTESISGQYIFIISESLDENEWRYLNRDSNKIELHLISARKAGHSYTVHHFKGNSFYAITNRTKNEVVQFSVDNSSEKNWSTLYISDNTIEDIALTKNYLAIKEYLNTGLVLKYLHLATKKVSEFSFEENLYSFDFVEGKNDTNTFQIDYQSPVTTYSLLNINLNTVQSKIVEKELLQDNFIPGNYKSETVWATAEDGKKIPVTLFYHEQKSKEALNGVLLKAYGAYGAKRYPEFDVENIIYANQGFIVAYAHVRGGGELGKEWYSEGKGMNKMNSFEDYISAAKYLQEKFNISPKKFAGYGLSAGGLIVGYAANNYPELFNTLILDRPYLDVINTMTNEDIPLTTSEYKEWGNPKDSLSFNYILKYSPYQNIKAQSFPNMMFLAKFNDEQAPYWQIAKSAAKIRNNNQSNSIILLNTDLNSGHRGSVNPGNSIGEMADRYAFIMYTIMDRNKISVDSSGINNNNSNR